MVQDDADLILRQAGLHVAVGQRVEVGIPLPDAHVVDLGRRHRLAGGVEAR